MPKLTDLTKEMTTAPADGDLMHIVDISDTSESPQGSSYKIKDEILFQDNLTKTTSAGLLTGGAITDAGSETIDVALGTGFFRTTDSHNGTLKQLSWNDATRGIATNTVKYIGVDYNSGSPIIVVKTTDLWDKHTEFRLGSVVNENSTLRILNNPWVVANATGHAIERFFETLPFKRADRIGGLIIGETGTRNVTVTASEIYDLTNEFTIAAIDTSVSGGFDTYLGLTLQAAAATQWDNLNYNNGGVLTALGVAKWGTLWWYMEADGNLVMNYGIVQHNTQAGADLEGEPPVRPVRVQVHGTLIGRTIFQQNAGTGDFQSAFITQFAGAGSSDHTQLSNLTTGDAGHSQFTMNDGRAGGQTIHGGTLTTQTAALRNNSTDLLGLDVNANGSISVNTANYETVVTADNVLTNKKYVDTHQHLIDLQNIIYVNGAGNDSNSGKNQGAPKLTIASALTAAAAQSPSATKIVVVKVLGGQRYAEDVTIPSWVVLDMSDALSYGQVTVGVTMGADSFYYFNEALMPSGKESIRCIGTGIRYIKGNFTTPETSSTFLTASGGATIYLDIVNADAVKTGATFSTLSTGAVLFLKAQTFRETVASTSVGATVFRNIVDDGSNADTSSINETGNHIIRGKDKVSLGTAAVASVVDIEGVGPKWLTAPSFVANLTGDANDVTGDGTTYTVICDNEVADIGGHYNNATGAFTGPTTGLYQFDIVALMKGFTSAHMLSIYLNVAGGTPQNWLLFDVNAANVRTGTPYYIALTGCTTVKLNSGDVAKAHINVRGGASKVVDVLIGTKFAGRLLTKI